MWDHTVLPATRQVILTPLPWHIASIHLSTLEG